MYVESEALNRLHEERDALVAEIATCEQAGDPRAADALRARLAEVQRELDELDLAEELGRQLDA